MPPVNLQLCGLTSILSESKSSYERIAKIYCQFEHEAADEELQRGKGQLIMKANELMVDDVVFVDDDSHGIRSYAIITRLYDNIVDFVDTIAPGTVEDKYVKGIPLTADILEMNGFEKSTESPLYTVFRLIVDEGKDDVLFVLIGENTNYISISFAPSGSDDDTNMTFVKKGCCVHDLQHVLRMCGIDKPIKRI